MARSSGVGNELGGKRPAGSEVPIEQLDEIFRSLAELSHKINNPLTAVMGRAQLLRAYRDMDPKVVKAAEIIEESAGRIAGLIREVAQIVKAGREQVLAELHDSATPDGSEGDAGA